MKNPNSNNTPPTWVRKLMAVSTSASNSGEHSHSIPDTCKYFFGPERNPLSLELVPAGDSWILWDLQPRNGEGEGESCHQDKLRYINDQIWEIQGIVVAKTESKRCFVFFCISEKQVVEAVLLDVFVFVFLLYLFCIFWISENLKTSCRNGATGCLDDWAAAFSGAISPSRLKKNK